MNIFSFLKNFFSIYSTIFFINDYRIGFVIFLLSFYIPSVGFLGLISLLSVFLIDKIINFKENLFTNSYYLYNSLLVGMGIGYYFNFSVKTLFLTILFSFFTFILSFNLKNILIKYRIPILSLPFSIISIFFFLTTKNYHTLYNIIDEKLLKFDFFIPYLSPFFKSLGYIIFLPYTITGLIISILIFIYSRILFFLAFIGFFIGVFFHSIYIPFEQALNIKYNFNFIIIAMSIGGYFFILNYKTFFITIISILLSVIFMDATITLFNIYKIPIYTLPFNIIVTSIIFFFSYINYKYLNLYYNGKPEEILINYLNNFKRFDHYTIKIHLPFIGKWNVYQAFDDKWTHKGTLKYAYDFVKKINGKTYKNEGIFLEDYYCFGQNIISPISGYVVDLRNDLPDNFIGNVDKINNWGNYIIIKSDLGFYVEISHLMQYSINVKIGDYVKIGDIIAKCGNSGYSPEPHIHIQVQKTEYLGSETLPFVFIDNLYQDKKLLRNVLPNTGENVHSIVPSKNLLLNFNFILEDTFIYKIKKNNKIIIDDYVIITKMNNNYEYYFEDNFGNQLFFFISYNKYFYFYKYIEKNNKGFLKYFYLLSPKIPLVIEEVKFYEILPLNLILKSKLKIFFYKLITFINNDIFFRKIEYYKKNEIIESNFGYIKFSFYKKGIISLFYKDDNILLELKNI